MRTLEYDKEDEASKLFIRNSFAFARIRNYRRLTRRTFSVSKKYITGVCGCNTGRSYRHAEGSRRPASSLKAACVPGSCDASTASFATCTSRSFAQLKEENV